MLRSILRALPLRCQLCHHRLEQRQYPWCETCSQSFPTSPRCMQCGLSTPYTMETCGRCLNTPPAWDNLVCLGDYTFPYDTLLHKFKYQGHYWLAAPLARLLAESIDEPAPCLIPVPMHWRRRWVRGFNHSTVLANALASQLERPCLDNALIRTRATQQQQGLSRKARLSNLKDAFNIHGDLPSHVALVDDVVTTGATLTELCRLLKAHGVIKIDIYALCRTPTDGKQKK